VFTSRTDTWSRVWDVVGFLRCGDVAQLVQSGRVLGLRAARYARGFKSRHRRSNEPTQDLAPAPALTNTNTGVRYG
jgi:hypothetical protein